MNVADTNPPGPGRHMLRGSAWMVAQRWSLRLSGIISTAILARILLPADFGIIAIAMIFVGVVEAVGDTGERLALLRHPAPQRDHYETAWTLQLLVGMAVCATILLLAPLANIYFHQPDTVPVIRFLSLRALLGGFENIATIDFRRELKFDRLYQLSLWAKFLSMATAIGLAIVLGNYWALAWGIVAGQAATTVLSYVMRPFRPRISLARRAEIVSFSAWTLLRSLGLYFTNQVDQIAVGGFGSAGAMGRYAVASDVAASPITEINEPVMAVLYPVMARISHDKPAVRALFLRTLGWSAVISAAAAAGVASIAYDYVSTILGGAWVDAAILVPWLAIAAGLLGSSSGADATFDMLGLPQRSTKLQWFRFGLFVAAIVPVAFFTRNVEWVAAARLAMSCVFVPFMLAAIGKATGLSLADIMATVWRPLLSAAIMSASIVACMANVKIAALERLLIELPLGAAVYGATLLLLWQVAGRPPSPEQDAVNFLRSLGAPGSSKRGNFVGNFFRSWKRHFQNNAGS